MARKPLFRLAHVRVSTEHSQLWARSAPYPWSRNPRSTVNPSRTSIITLLLHRRYVYDHSGRKYGGKLPMVGFMTEWVRSKGHGFKSQVCC